MKLLSIQANEAKPNSSALSFNEFFFKPLYTNSKLPRIVLQRSICQFIKYDKWYRIDLKLVTEMGLPVDSHKEPIILSGSMLISRSGYYENSGSIETRPIISADNWEPEIANSEGFNPHSSLGALEYRIGSSDSHLETLPFYISLQVVNKKRNILPLCVGPIWIQNQQQDDMNENWWTFPHSKIEKQQYRALQVKSQQSKYFLIKEQWEDGTSGKIWDSALFMVDVLISNFHLLYGKRILDLSAGTGYVGLSLAQLFQNLSDPAMKKQQPQITLSDIHEVLDLIKVNQTLNCIKNSEHLKIEPLRWGNAQDAKSLLSKQKGKELDIIIASDIIYRKNEFRNILTTFRQLCIPKTIIYLGCKLRGLRSYEEREFFDECNKYFNIHLLTYKEPQQTIKYNQTDVKLYKMQLRIKGKSPLL
ncbi:hypothetical protein G6F37_001466 [Rhizopus arrhizus]|nr:hypothetical protein G6F38_002151 [Rhizopus arrhizus]KAG1163175.1 hypothetical protein G6F37_001466 [Rhizopus arrhizus]